MEESSRNCPVESGARPRAKLAEVAFIVVALAGAFSVLTAFTVSHAIYVQVQVLRTELKSPEGVAKANALEDFGDHACALFGIVGAIQVAVAVIGLVALRRAREKESLLRSFTAPSIHQEPKP
jgi:hypothetical protein